MVDVLNIHTNNINIVREAYPIANAKLKIQAQQIAVILQHEIQNSSFQMVLELGLPY